MRLFFIKGYTGKRKIFFVELTAENEAEAIRKARAEFEKSNQPGSAIFKAKHITHKEFYPSDCCRALGCECV